MRGVKAKILRSLARKTSVGSPLKEYHYTNLRYLLTDRCTRKHYKRLKKAYKNGIRITNSKISPKYI